MDVRRLAIVAGLYGLRGVLGDSAEMMMHDPPKRPKVVLFDVNETLFDLTPLRQSLSELLGADDDLLPLWFTTTLHHSLVETVTGSYKEFSEIGAAAMMMLAARRGIELDINSARRAIAEISECPLHGEVADSLSRLGGAGFVMGALTNSPQDLVEMRVEKAGIRPMLSELLSAGAIETYKPHVSTYQWAAKKMKVTPTDCLFVAAHGWDIAGAMRAGMRGLFVARPGANLYPLADMPEHVCKDLSGAADYLLELWEE